MRSILLLFIFISGGLFAQYPCGTYSAGRLIQPNHVAAWHSPTGTQFFDGQNSRIQIPHDVPDAPYVLCALTPWLHARSENGDTLTSTARFSNTLTAQWFAGPLAPGAIPYANACSDFDHVWSVTLGEILAHQADWSDDGVISDTVASVFGWPAEGNPFFEGQNGFPLPADHLGQWAEFADLNDNGQYEPHLGEYPCIHIEGEPWLPDEMHWLVTHDMGQSPLVSRDPVGMELQLTVYGFYCQDEPVLDHTLFHRFKLINPRQEALDSVYFGLWFDPDLGCADDDMMGCDTLRSTALIFNQDAVDGDPDGECFNFKKTYTAYPPIQSITWLDRPMHAFGGLNAWPDTDTDYYPWALFGRNADGSPITPGGNGQNPGDTLPAIRFLYPGDPRDTVQWSMYDAPNAFERQQTGVTSVYLDHIDPGAVVMTDVAHIYHLDSSLVHLENYPLMQGQVDRVRTDLPGLLSSCARYPVCAKPEECVWPGDFDHNGIVDPYDMLLWGAMNGAEGPRRDGRINWTGHAAEPWQDVTNEGIGYQHGDADGNGRVDEWDFALFEQHNGYTHPLQWNRDPYPEGDDLVIVPDYYTSAGLRNSYVRTKRALENIMGLAFEMEIDTSLFANDYLTIAHAPGETNALILSDQGFQLGGTVGSKGYAQYAMVFLDGSARTLPAGYALCRFFRLQPKPGVTLPDSLTLRLRDLVAVDADGNNLYLGSRPVTVYMETTSASDPQVWHKGSSLWPNPTADLLHVDTPVPGAADLYDTQGHLVRSWSAGELAGPLSLADLPPGLYVLRLRGTGEALKVMRH